VSTNHPLITIGITCYNAADTIERAIISAAQQSWPSKEIVVVDDASTDGSVDAIHRVCATYREIRLLRHEANRGYPASLNTILKAARGEFVAFFDDDDQSREDRLERQWQRIHEYERAHGTSLVFCYSNREVVLVGHDAPGFTTLAIGRRAPEPHGEMIGDFLLCLIETPPFTWGQFGSCTLMSRCSTLVRLGGFDEMFRRGAEWDMAIRAGLVGAHFIAVDQPLVTQHLTKGNGNEKSGNSPLRYALALRYKHRAHLSERGLYWAALAQAYSRFYYARGERLPHRIYTAFACMLAPRKLLPRLMAQRSVARNR
jgi:glycosyltransferase involved in cell wall biosynthesis